MVASFCLWCRYHNITVLHTIFWRKIGICLGEKNVCNQIQEVKKWAKLIQWATKHAGNIFHKRFMTRIQPVIFWFTMYTTHIPVENFNWTTYKKHYVFGCEKWKKKPAQSEKSISPSCRCNKNCGPAGVDTGAAYDRD